MKSTQGVFWWKRTLNRYSHFTWRSIDAKPALEDTERKAQLLMQKQGLVRTTDLEKSKLISSCIKSFHLSLCPLLSIAPLYLSELIPASSLPSLLSLSISLSHCFLLCDRFLAFSLFLLVALSLSLSLCLSVSLSLSLSLSLLSLSSFPSLPVWSSLSLSLSSTPLGLYLAIPLSHSFCHTLYPCYYLVSFFFRCGLFTIGFFFLQGECDFKIKVPQNDVLKRPMLYVDIWPIIMNSILGPAHDIYLDQILTYTFWPCLVMLSVFVGLKQLFYSGFSNHRHFLHPPIFFWNAICEHNYANWTFIFGMYVAFMFCCFFRVPGFVGLWLDRERQTNKSRKLKENPRDDQ